ncbi:MAG: AAA family ATPase [Flavobacteriia bacterium]|nr:AAA family ATPase [Flavobacteriia bacterium]
MKRLIDRSVQKAKDVSGRQFRYLHDDIDWNQRLIILLGHRGSGKTTMLLQKMNQGGGVYISLDDFYFESNRLIHLVDDLYQKGIRSVFLDEIHTYKYWSKDLKQLTDDYSDLKIVATGSSILNISKGNADLSRRAVIYHLQGLSFREFLQFEKISSLKKLTLNEIIKNHHEISTEISDKIDIIKNFEKYLKFGYYPFYIEGKKSYYQKLEETVKIVLENDIAHVEELNYSTVRLMKKMMYFISQSVPFTPNISKLAEKLDAPRNTVLRLLDLLHEAKILHLLKTNSKGISYLQKPEKIFLENTNLMYLFSIDKVNIGNIRETFFLNQVSVKHEVNSPKYGDFLVDQSYVFEIGGASKTFHQISGVPNSYLAIDIEHGNGNKIPLWMFGFLY